jgi:hypothetical protein
MPAPEELIRVSEEAMKHPDVSKVGITKTPDGRYALLATVRKLTPTPVTEIERIADGFPVIYREEEDRLPVAWPARPGQRGPA